MARKEFMSITDEKPQRMLPENRLERDLERAKHDEERRFDQYLDRREDELIRLMKVTDARIQMVLELKKRQKY